MSPETLSEADLKSTLNLPKTGFPMKANLGQNEKVSRKRWDALGLYEKMLEKGEESFLLHDGPPYANGDIHMGHLLNKVLKDMVVRSQAMAGKKAPFRPGWDCHGLPIEYRVLSEKNRAEKLATLPKTKQQEIIRKESESYAAKCVKQQAEQMQALLTVADYPNPYLTMQPQYEADVLRVFAQIINEGIVYRQLKPVHWSIANQTALADAELEYQDRMDPSIYVKFEAHLNGNCPDALKSEEPLSFLIWTTTPWTLPANQAIAVHPRFNYQVLNTAEHGRILIGEDLIESFTENTGITGKVEANISGEALAGLEYEHPFIDARLPLVTAEYVTADAGTGLVHTAPGHGIDDYHSGQKYGLPTYCPVQGDGTYDDTVPDWLQGLSIYDANPEIIKRLKESGAMLHHSEFSHSYPHDWRSKTPVIFRSTEQWFIAVDKALNSSQKTLRDMAISSLSDVSFTPDWGENRLRGMLEARPDWCISRQRSWGLPIPAFRDANGEVLMTRASVNAIADEIAIHGSSHWFAAEPSTLLSGYSLSEDADAPQAFDIASAEKMMDIFDVWFESGSSWAAVLDAQSENSPADLYLEGSDQHRGWFHLSLLISLAVKQRPPFKQILTHGFIVDKDGYKLSKSKGNALSVAEVLQKYGAEVTRNWVSNLSYESDIKLDLSILDAAGDSYRKIRNTLRFLLSNLNAYTAIALDDLYAELAKVPQNSIQYWILAETDTLYTTVRSAYESFNFKNANKAIFDFCNDTLSAIYCSTVKDRLYCDAPNSPRRQETQLVLQYLLEVLTRLLAPILPHTSDEAYRALYEGSDRCIHLQTFTHFKSAKSELWDLAIQCRSAVLKALEEREDIPQSLDALIILGSEYKALNSLASDLVDLFGVSELQFADTDTAVQVQDISSRDRCQRSWRRDPSVKIRDNGLLLSDRDALAVDFMLSQQ